MVTTNIKVREYHLDQHGHVNNVRYMEFLEETRYDMLDPHAELLVTWKEKGLKDTYYRRRRYLCGHEYPDRQSNTFRGRAAFLHSSHCRTSKTDDAMK